MKPFVSVADVSASFNDKELLNILKGLIQQKSENPPGHEEVSAIYIKKVLEKEGIKAEMKWVEPGRPNLIARLKGVTPGSTMIYNGHLDVVPAGPNWKMDPYEGIAKDGKIYGRGAADMKSGLAAMIYAAIMLKRQGNPFSGELILFFNVDEERTNLGMKQFLLEDISADYAIISEPTHMNICTGHRGCARYRLSTKGLSGHTSFVTNPDNAIYKMTKLLPALENLGVDIKKRVDPFLGQSSLTVTQIKGGTAPNIVPDYCEIELDRRILPGETKKDAFQEIERCIKEVSTQYSFEYELECYQFLSASNISQNDSFVKHLQKVSQSIIDRKIDIKPFEATCEAPFFSIEKGIPTLICGPGGLEQAHIEDEFVYINEVIEAALVFYNLVKDILKEKVIS